MTNKHMRTRQGLQHEGEIFAAHVDWEIHVDIGLPDKLTGDLSRISGVIGVVDCGRTNPFIGQFRLCAVRRRNALRNLCDPLFRIDP